MATDGPYRVGNHSPINVWWDPHREYSTSEQVCMATSPEWGRRIVAALNAREVEPVVDSDLRDLAEQIARVGIAEFRAYTGTNSNQNMWNVDIEKTFHVVADAQAAVVAPVLAERDAEIERTRIQLADALSLSHSYALEALLSQVRELMRAYVAAMTDNEQVRADRSRERESRQAWQEKLAQHEFKLADALGIVGAEEGIDPYEAVVALHAEVDKLRAELDAARTLLDTFVDESLCHVDHHGYCQEHGWLDKTECNVDRARKFLAGGRPVTGATEQAPHCWCARPSCSGCTPATSTEPRAVYHEPGDVQYEHDEDDNPVDPSVGWDIAFGCRVTFGIVDGVWRVDVAVSDAEKRDGGSIRSVTRQQIRAFAYQLIRLTEVGVVEDQAGGGHA